MPPGVTPAGGAADRIHDFADAFYYKRDKSISIMGGVAKVLREMSLEDKSEAVMREFLSWLERKM